MEIIYYDNRYMDNGGFSETDSITEIADIIKNAFNFATVSFEGNYDVSQKGENCITFKSGSENIMEVTLGPEDSRCDAIKFKDKAGSVTHIVYKKSDSSNTFIFRPPGGGQVTCYFDEVGLGIDGRQAYQSNNRAFLEDTFSFKVLEDKKNEANNTMITYNEANSNFNYSYSPLYYINNKQMSAIQNNYQPSAAKEFI